MAIHDARALIGASAASQLGDWLYNAALLGYVYSATGSAAWVGAATICRGQRPDGRWAGLRDGARRLGVDLIDAQLRSCLDEPLALSPSRKPRFHIVDKLVYAPTSGVLAALPVT